MGGACSSTNDDFQRQEHYVRKNFNKYNSQLGSRYSREQIECKIRQMYHHNDNRKVSTFISQSDWTRAKTGKKY